MAKPRGTSIRESTVTLGAFGKSAERREKKSCEKYILTEEVLRRLPGDLRCGIIQVDKFELTELFERGMTIERKFNCMGKRDT